MICELLLLTFSVTCPCQIVCVRNVGIKSSVFRNTIKTVPLLQCPNREIDNKKGLITY